MTYPSTTRESTTAVCYVCEEEISKVHMVCIGPDHDNEGKYIYRCDDCFTGSPKWIKHFMHKSKLGDLFINVVKAQEAERSGENSVPKPRKIRKDRLKKLRERSDKPAVKTKRRSRTTPETTKEVKGGRKKIGRRKRNSRNVSIRRSG